MAHAFEELCKVEVFLQGQDGQKEGPYKCALSEGTATLFEEKIDVQEGDKVLRELPGGRVESYTVLEANYSPGLQPIPPNWQLLVRKDTSLVEKGGGKTVNVSIQDSHGIQIGDQNIQNVTTTFELLVSAIEKSEASEEEKAEAKGRLKKFVDHPLVTSILGGAAGGLAGILSGP